MAFIDQVILFAQSGDGGAGCSSFRREKFVPRGGPDGGDGGTGGNVYVVGDPSRNTLLGFRNREIYKAGNGDYGRGKKQHGKAGRDRYLNIPLGTTVYVLPPSEAHTYSLTENVVEQYPELVLDITSPDTTLLLAGGKGGRGNARFSSSVNQTPLNCEPGLPGKKHWVRLELQLLADVGLVGLPNAGKSTLISRLSKATPKVADYPFTTLMPQLGVVQSFDHTSFVMADIPGIIQGAHQGAGLGLQFLRHIRRSAFLLWMLPFGEGSERILTHYNTLREELGCYASALLDKPRVVVLTKSDLTSNEEAQQSQAQIAALGEHCFCVSAHNGDGLTALLTFLHTALKLA